jgi:DNA-binding GntR family transcriptional regulator
MRASAETASLAAEAYNVVRQRIARGELVLGQPVSRRRLAAELGMSFLRVTEALLRLEFEGLLESRPRPGTRVRIPLPQDVEGNYIVRQALETQAAILCSRTICHADIRNGRRNSRRQPTGGLPTPSGSTSPSASATRSNC